MTNSPDGPKLLEAIASAVQQREPKDTSLTVKELSEVVARSLSQVAPKCVIPIHAWWIYRDKRWQKKIDETLAFLQERLAMTMSEVAGLRTYYQSDEFGVLFEACWLRLQQAAQQRKIEALRGALLSILERRPDFKQDKKESFVRALGRLGDVDIYVLQIYRDRLPLDDPHWFWATYQIFEVLGVTTESDQDQVYAALDTLANLCFIRHGSIPRRGGPDGPIDFPNQQFRATALGAEFLEFVRMGVAKDTSGPAGLSEGA